MMIVMDFFFQRHAYHTYLIAKSDNEKEQWNQQLTKLINKWIFTYLSASCSHCPDW